MISITCLKNWNDFKDSTECNWQVIDLKITQQEGHIAKANLKVANFELPNLPYICIYEKDELLLQGIIGNFFNNNGYVTDVELLCISPNFSDDLKTLINTSNLPYLPIFFQGQRHKTSDVLESNNMLFRWNKEDGAVTLSNYFKGNNTIDIGENYIEKSLQIRQINSPLSKAELNLKVQWLQNLEGSFNAAPYIAKAFPGNVIASITPESLMFEWPKDNQKLGMGKQQSGYKAIKAFIKPIDAPPNMPTHTKKFENKITQSSAKRLKIHYFKGHLRILWNYQQTRVEEYCVSASIKHNTLSLVKQQSLKIPISITLPKCEKAVFFETQQGIELVEYAKKVLNARILATLRCIEIKCKIPWQIAKKLTLDNSLSINASLFGKNKITGKLTKVVMHANGLNRIGEISIACTLENYENQKANIHFTSNDYIQEPFLGDEIISNDKLYGITHSILLGKDLIENVEVKNNFLEQTAKLEAANKASSNAIHYALADYATHININLKDLRSKNLLSRTFKTALPEIIPAIQ